MILVTGGAGFIGSNFVLDWLVRHDEPVVNLDALTHASDMRNLRALEGDARHRFVRASIDDAPAMAALLRLHEPRAIVHFAAQTHVDRSISDPGAFVRTNVLGTQVLLEAARQYVMALPADRKESFRFLQVSTDEVYGTLAHKAPAFSEADNLAPNNPYAASKAACDHLVRAYFQTYGLPVLTTRCSNNYGPRQFPEKLIPLMVHNALQGQELPIYGDGQQRRDWLHVADHCAAIRQVLEAGRLGEVYNVGAGAERANLDVVHAVCDLLDELKPLGSRSYREQIRFVADRPGHDRRYAIDSRKIQRELGWSPTHSFELGIRQTLAWYLDNASQRPGGAPRSEPAP